VLSSDAPKDLSKRKAGEAYIGAVVAALFEPYSSLLEVDGDKRNVFIGRKGLADLSCTLDNLPRRP